MFGVFFYVSLYMQQVLGFSPIEAGRSFLPMDRADHPARAAGRPPVRPRRVARLVPERDARCSRPRSFSSRGMGVDASFWGLLPAMLLGGIGMAATMAPITAAAMARCARDKAGVGSAVLNSMRQVGGSLGIAIMGAIVAAGTTSGLRRVDAGRLPSCTASTTRSRSQR